MRVKRSPLFQFHPDACISGDRNAWVLCEGFNKKPTAAIWLYYSSYLFEKTRFDACSSNRYPMHRPLGFRDGKAGPLVKSLC